MVMNHCVMISSCSGYLCICIRTTLQLNHLWLATNKPLSGTKPITKNTEVLLWSVRSLVVFCFVLLTCRFLSLRSPLILRMTSEVTTAQQPTRWAPSPRSFFSSKQVCPQNIKHLAELNVLVCLFLLIKVLKKKVERSKSQMVVSASVLCASLMTSH